MKIFGGHARKRFWVGLCLLLATAVGHAANTVTYVYTDPQGTPLAEADVNGNITATYNYTPYGSMAPNMSAPPNGPGYTGHVNDPDTGFVYMQARYYDPAVGRFLSTDPIGPAASDAFNFNRYAYANNNPVVNVDPNGKQETPVDEPSADSGLDASGNPVLGPNMSGASPFAPLPGESSEDFSIRQQAAFERMDSTPEKNAKDDATSDNNMAKYSPGAKFSPTTKQQTADNADHTCEYCSVKTTPAEQSKKGVTPADNEGQTDHIVPRSRGGDNSPENAAHSCRACNIRFSNTPKPHPRASPPPPPPPPNPSTPGT